MAKKQLAPLNVDEKVREFDAGLPERESAHGQPIEPGPPDILHFTATGQLRQGLFEGPASPNWGDTHPGKTRRHGKRQQQNQASQETQGPYQ